jgi:hypothetical protein
MPRPRLCVACRCEHQPCGEHCAGQRAEGAAELSLHGGRVGKPHSLLLMDRQQQVTNGDSHKEPRDEAGARKESERIRSPAWLLHLGPPTRSPAQRRAGLVSAQVLHLLLIAIQAVEREAR